MSTYTMSAEHDQMFEVIDYEAFNDEDALVHASQVLVDKMKRALNTIITDGILNTYEQLWVRGTITIKDTKGKTLHTIKEEIQ